MIFSYRYFIKNFTPEKFHKNLIDALFSDLYKNVGRD